jgi:hypothetical protein
LLYDGVRLLACAVTVSDKGEMGLIVGRMGIGAPLDGPLFHVDLLAAGGRVFVTGISVDACTGEGRGATFSFPDECTTLTELSDRPINDFLNHDDFEDDVVAASVKSLEPR